MRRANIVLFCIAILTPIGGHAMVNMSEKISHTIVPSKCVEFDPISEYRFKAHCEDWIKKDKYAAKSTYNANGLRDKDYAPKPKPGVIRVLFTGPSRIVAPGLKEEDVPIRKLEALLKKRGIPVEIINAGVEGYATGHFYVKIKDWIKAYSPDYVFVYIETSKYSVNDTILSHYIVTKEGSPAIAKFSSLERSFLRIMSEKLHAKKIWKPIATVKDMSYLLWDSLKCKIKHPFSQQEAYFCFLQPTIQFAKGIENITKENGIKILFLYREQLNSNGIYASPGYSSSILNFFNIFQPKIVYTDKDQQMEKMLSAILPIKKIILPLDEKTTINGDEHFNELGSERFAQATLQPVIEIIEKFNNNKKQ